MTFTSTHQLKTLKYFQSLTQILAQSLETHEHKLKHMDINNNNNDDDDNNNNNKSHQ